MKEEFKDFNIAKSWNELNSFQLGEILTLFMSSEKIPINEFRLLLLTAIFIDESPEDQSETFEEKTNNFAYLLAQVHLTKQSEDDNSYLFKHIEFLEQSVTLTKFPETIKIDDQTFYGPANRLSNLTIEELSFADHIYFDWFTKRNPIDLDRLISVIYRPQSTVENIDDIRQNFSRQTLVKRGEIIPKLDEKIKLQIGFGFKGSRESLFSKFPIIFPKRKSSFKKDERKPVKYKSFNPMITTMAMGETTPLGNLHEVKKTNAVDFFEVVQETIIMDRKRKEQQKS